jgi:osmotically inducible lipoprotein OsmB
MKSMLSAAILLPLALSLSACGDSWGQRSVTGAGIGAGAGLAIGALAGWPLLGPALVGAALGGGIGAATTPGGIK